MSQRGRLGARLAAVVGAAAIALGVVLTPIAAHADGPTTIEFTETTPISVDFGEKWSLSLVVATQYEGGPNLRLGVVAGTVDVYLSGIAGAYATGLPIQPDGLVYLAQPLDKPLLGAGEYSVTAIFNPAPGGFLQSSQTTVPRALSVAALGLTPRIEATIDPAVSPYPVISASLDGQYVEARGGVPAGTWGFTVTTAKNVVFEADVAQRQGSEDPVRVEIDSRLPDGADFTVKATFTPVEELKDGIVVTTVNTARFSTPGTTLVDALTSPIPFPSWLVLAIGALLAALVAAVVVLGVKTTGRATITAAPGIPGESAETQIISWEDAGIMSNETNAQLAEKTWSLSDDDSPAGELEAPDDEPQK